MDDRDDRIIDTRYDPPDACSPGRWLDGQLPPNVRIGCNSEIMGDHSFRRFRSRLDRALTIGAHCTLDGVHFALGEEGRVEIGDYCYLTNAVLLCELELRIGNYVVIGWNATLADTDFHPLTPAARIADAVACSPLGAGHRRPEIVRRPVIIEDDVWIGPNATILKGVRIGTGAFIEAGALVTRDVPPCARVLGNPAQIVGRV
ncbi:MAG: acyltransferase [Armatimonadota bacterium]|nr:acyltransferase [Armatimonadota bacterium]